MARELWKENQARVGSFWSLRTKRHSLGVHVQGTAIPDSNKHKAPYPWTLPARCLQRVRAWMWEPWNQTTPCCNSMLKCRGWSAKILFCTFKSVFCKISLKNTLFVCYVCGMAMFYRCVVSVGNFPGGTGQSRDSQLTHLNRWDFSIYPMLAHLLALITDCPHTPRLKNFQQGGLIGSAVHQEFPVFQLLRSAR